MENISISALEPIVKIMRRNLMQVQTVDYHSANSPALFTQSLVETGFGIVKNHPINQQLIEQAYRDWHHYFLLDGKEQQEFLFDKKTHDGHIPLELSETAKGYNIKDIKEFYHYYFWGRCPSYLQEVTHSLYTQLISLAAELLRWIEENTPTTISKNFSMPLSKMIENSPNSLFRIIHYPPLTGNEQEGAIRAAAHEDINLITLLPAATAEGLQVLTKNNQWLDIPCHADTIIINTGDMLHECTEGYYRTTTHRVINPKGEKAKQARLSMPLFLHPCDQVVLSKRHTRKSYCEERFKELGLL